jgi:hypothetical protein
LGETPDRWDVHRGIVCRSTVGVNDFSKRLRLRIPFLKQKGPRLSGPKRPQRSNSAVDIVRGIKTLKTIYWTTSRLMALLPRVFSNKREEHFARALQALKAWPEKNPEQNLEDASRINPRRINGRWYWPSYDHSVERLLREYADRAPPAGIDPDKFKLRNILAGMDDRTRQRFMEEVVIPNLPPQKGTPTGWDTRVLMSIRRAHKRMMKSLARDPRQKESGHWIREIDLNQGAKVPTQPRSPAGRFLDPTGWWWVAKDKDLPR